MRRLALDNFLSHVKHDHETLVDRFNHTGGHGVGGVPVAGTDPAAAVQLAAAAALVAYQLVNHTGRDAGSSSQVEKVCRKFGPPSGMAPVAE
jgi:hypothetical protein